MFLFIPVIGYKELNELLSATISLGRFASVWYPIFGVNN
jgi:hypothetical protein